MKIINLIENLDDTYGGPAKSVPYMCKYLNDISVDTEILSVKFHDSEMNSLVNKYNLTWKSFKYNFVKKLRISFDLEKYFNTQISTTDRRAAYNNIYNYSQAIKREPKNPANFLNRGVM